MPYIACEMVKSPYFGILYDPMNLASAGVDFKKATALFLDHIVHVHLKDCQLPIGDKEVYAQLGEGIVEPLWVIKTVRGAGYNGHIALEYEIPVVGKNPKKEIIDNLKKWYLYIDSLKLN